MRYPVILALTFWAVNSLPFLGNSDPEIIVRSLNLNISRAAETPNSTLSVPPPDPFPVTTSDGAVVEVYNYEQSHINPPVPIRFYHHFLIDLIAILVQERGNNARTPYPQVNYFFSKPLTSDPLGMGPIYASLDLEPVGAYRLTIGDVMNTIIGFGEWFTMFQDTVPPNAAIRLYDGPQGNLLGEGYFEVAIEPSSIRTFSETF